MGKNREILNYNKRFNSKCTNGTTICNLVTELEGKQNRRIALILQLAYSGLALMVLGNNSKEGKDFLISLFLFCGPLFLEYIYYESEEKLNNWIYLFQKICFGIGSFIGMVGSLSDVITIKMKGADSYIVMSNYFFILKGKYISIKWILVPLSLSVFCILITIFSLRSALEKNVASQTIA